MDVLGKIRVGPSESFFLLIRVKVALRWLGGQRVASEGFGSVKFSFIECLAMLSTLHL